MSILIGIRHEDKYKMELRAPLTPAHIQRLGKAHGLKFVVQTSDKRIFSDAEYQQVGCRIAHDLKDCQVIFGVKEIPEAFFEPQKTYIFFSHVIKGQSYNMPMLRRMMELKCNLIDYERIADEQNKRMIFFGRFAGLAGMINSLWSVGQRLKHLGQPDNVFLPIKQAHHYHSLEEARVAISKVGQEIARKGLPKEIQPFTIGFTGYGNVSQGAQEIVNLLPSQEISPRELKELQRRDNTPGNVIYKVIFKEQHLVRPKDGSTFELQDYYDHPEKYESKFEQYLPHLSVLMNCMYWDGRYSRIVTREYMRREFLKSQHRLLVIGDVTCDPEGSVEITHKGTAIEDPVFVYDPATDQPTMGFEGRGVLVMAVDILPSELPRDASVAFADVLEKFVKPIATADFSLPFDQLQLPAPIKKALILHQGQLTPDYEYLNEYLNQ
ncbi:MAG: bifunctional lysine ketoglutarate reductase /saccharopine dehydrogenase family protein [Bacteroidales bacterium]